MDVYEAIRTRRSVRRYKPDDLPDEVLDRVLEAMLLAPSAKNAQPWRFVVVRDAAARKALVPVCRNQKFIAEAPLVIVACGIEREAYPYMGGYWNSVAVDVAIAVDHLTLAAAAEGLGTCWIGAFDERGVKELLGIPEDVLVVALTPLGYPAESPSFRGRKSPAETLFLERWGRSMGG